MKTNDSKKISKLKSLFSDFIHIPFPNIKSSEELQEIKSELVLYDGHVAGLVSSYLQGAPVNIDLVKADSILEKQLQDFYPKTHKEEKSLQDLKDYKHRLDELIFSLSENMKEN